MSTDISSLLNSSSPPSYPNYSTDYSNFSNFFSSSYKQLSVSRGRGWYIGFFILIFFIIVLICLLAYQSGIPSSINIYGNCSGSNGDLGELLTEITVIIGLMLAIYLIASYGRLFKDCEKLNAYAEKFNPEDPNKPDDKIKFASFTEAVAVIDANLTSEVNSTLTSAGVNALYGAGLAAQLAGQAIVSAPALLLS